MIRPALIRIIKREAFRPGLLGIFINPFYIIRRGIYNAVADIAPTIIGKVMDFGCGAKPYEELFVNADAYVGVDLRDSGHKDYDSKVDVYYDGEILPFDDNSFDAVVSFEVFEHVFNLDEIIDEVHRVLKCNGDLFFTIPFLWDEHEKPYDFGRYTSFGIKSILEKNGFKDINITKTTNYYEAISQISIAYYFQHVLPGNDVVKRIIYALLVSPLMIKSVVMGKIMPLSYDCYCNLAVVCKKA